MHLKDIYDRWNRFISLEPVFDITRITKKSYNYTQVYIFLNTTKVGCGAERPETLHLSELILLILNIHRWNTCSFTVANITHVKLSLLNVVMQITGGVEASFLN